MTYVDYINDGVNNVEKVIRGIRTNISRNTTTPMMNTHELDSYGSPELEGKDTQRFQELIGVIR